MGYILILGAGSDIAKALASEYAKEGNNLYLALRDSTAIKQFSQALKDRYKVDVKVLSFDALNCESHKAFYASLSPKPEGVVVAVGYLGQQKVSELAFSEAKRVIDTNFTSLVSILNIVATEFEAKKSGFIVGISSVAGDRGRQSNYIYGSAKAGFSAYLSGLRNRLYKSGVPVLTVKPGFVATKMTAGMKLPKGITATPEKVARDILRAQKKGVDVLYTIAIWRLIMAIMRSVPEFIFKRLNT